jgi:Right handed beta helix region
VYQAYWDLYAPTGSGWGHGAVDLVGCAQVVVNGCTLSSLGDTTRFRQCQGLQFSQNTINGARMGALFIAEFCQNVTIVGNTVNGTNGSRVLTVEESGQNVTVSGNTFVNGGRGSWFNQPQQLVLEGNVFVNNTTKGARDPLTGCRCLETGDYERYPEMSFTTYAPGGTYGNVLIQGNSFTTGPGASAAIAFAPGGNTLQVQNNTFTGPVLSVSPWPVTGCTNVTFSNNPGLGVK